MKSKSEMMRELSVMLRKTFADRAHGSARPRLDRAHGYADGYMRALIECGVASQRELLDMVAQERTYASGPALGELTVDALA